MKNKQEIIYKIEVKHDKGDWLPYIDAIAMENKAIDDIIYYRGMYDQCQFRLIKCIITREDIIID